MTTQQESQSKIRSQKPSSGRRVSRALASALVMVAIAAGTRAEESAPPASPPPGDVKQIEITRTATSWDNLSELFLNSTPAQPFGEGSVFVLRGELVNRGTQPVHHVVIHYELFDENGKVVHSADGYNRNAESMRPNEDGQVQHEKVRPIAANGSDSYRMVFFPDEIPRFASQRVRIREVHLEKK